MKQKRYKAHPLMVFWFLKPFLFVLILPLLKGAVQYLLYNRVSGIISLEGAAFVLIFALAVFRFLAFGVYAQDNKIIIKQGLFIRRRAEIYVSQISSVTISRSPIDYIFGAVTYQINTEAGRSGNADFEFKLYLKGAQGLSDALYGKDKRIPYKFSPLKIALLSATTSSAFTGLIIGVPILNRIGNLAGVGLSEMLFDEINNVSHKASAYIPPIINIITLIFLLGYGFAFLLSFFKNIRLRLLVGTWRVEIRSGLFVHRQTLFKKRAINDVCVEQTPLMRPFGLFSLNAAVAGLGNAKDEKATVIPCASYKEVHQERRRYFPHFDNKAPLLKPVSGKRALWRFLFIPRNLAMGILLLTVPPLVFFSYFDSLLFFVAVVAMAVTTYYATLCIWASHHSVLCLDDTVTGIGTRFFTKRELSCNKDRIGVIALRRTPADRRMGTCAVKITIRSESADSIRVKMLPLDEVKEKIKKTFKLDGIDTVF